MGFNYTDAELLAMTPQDVFEAIRNDDSPFDVDDLERWWYVHFWDN